MDKHRLSSYLLAFGFGIVLTLLWVSRPNEARYMPFGSDGKQVLDTRNGRVYKISIGSYQGIHYWESVVQKVGKKK